MPGELRTRMWAKENVVLIFGCTLDIGRGLGGPIVGVWYCIQSDQTCVWRFDIVGMGEENGWSMQEMASRWQHW